MAFDGALADRSLSGEVLSHASSSSAAAKPALSSTKGVRGVLRQPVDVSRGYHADDQEKESCGSSSISSSPAPSPGTTDEDYMDGLALQAGASSVGRGLWRFTTTAKRPRAGSMTPKHGDQTSDRFAPDRGPGTPDFTLDRFAQIRGKRDAHYMRFQQDLSARSSLRLVSDTSLLPSHMSSPPSSPEPYARGHAPALQAWSNMNMQGCFQAATSAMVAHMRSFIVAAKIPPLRPHLPALLFLMTAFVGSTICILMALSTLPLHLPSHITDLTLAEIRDMSLSLRAYSRSSPRAFIHTLAVLGTFFTWKQSFTVPGSIIMNVVFGVMYGTWMGTLCTSLLTAVGGMFCYLLMAPLGPLINAMPGLNTALQKMQNALRGSMPLSGPHTPLASRTTQRSGRGRGDRARGSQRQLAATTTTSMLRGGSVRRNVNESRGASTNLWSYLLVLRLLPVVPYGLMNVACSVLRVPLLPYTVTLGLGSIPWNACTVQIGDLLVEVVSALPVAAAGPGSSLATPSTTNVQSGLRAISDKIWNRDMMLKLALMSMLSLAPMILQRWLKRRNGSASADDEYDDAISTDGDDEEDVDLLERQRALEDGTDEERERSDTALKATPTRSNDVGTYSMNGRMHSDGIADEPHDSDQTMRNWRASWHPGHTNHLPLTIADHTSPDKRHSLQMAHVALKEHRRTPPIKRAIADMIL